MTGKRASVLPGASSRGQVTVAWAAREWLCLASLFLPTPVLCWLSTYLLTALSQRSLASRRTWGGLGGPV